MDLSNLGSPNKTKRLTYHKIGGVAELADALDSKSSVLKDVEVRVLSPLLGFGRMAHAKDSAVRILRRVVCHS